MGDLDRGNMMDWSAMFNKRNFGGSAQDLGDFQNSANFIDWSDYFSKRGRVRRATKEVNNNKRFGPDVDTFGTSYNGHFMRNPMQFTDWRDSFARNYRSWNRNAVPAFGEHSSMVNWSDYFNKRAAEKKEAEKKEAEKKDDI